MSESNKRIKSVPFKPGEEIIPVYRAARELGMETFPGSSFYTKFQAETKLEIVSLEAGKKSFHFVRQADLTTLKRVRAERTQLAQEVAPAENAKEVVRDLEALIKSNNILADKVEQLGKAVSYCFERVQSMEAKIDTLLAQLGVSS